MDRGGQIAVDGMDGWGWSRGVGEKMGLGRFVVWREGLEIKT